MFNSGLQASNNIESSICDLNLNVDCNPCAYAKYEKSLLHFLFDNKQLDAAQRGKFYVWTIAQVSVCQFLDFFELLLGLYPILNDKK